MSRALRLLLVAAGPAILFAALLPPAASAATINVTTTSDDFNSDSSSCSLREAVQAASQNSTAQAPGCQAGDSGQHDTIVLPAAATTYQLSIPVDGTPDDNADGDLDITGGASGVTIQGTGASRPTITTGGGLVDRIIDLQSGQLILSGVAVTGGMLSAGDGGGVRANTGTLTIADSSISGNGTGSGDGGGVYASTASGPLSITGSAIDDNLAQGAGGGLAMYAEAPSLSVASSSIDGNTLTAPSAADTLRGGGLFSRSRSNSIIDSTVSGNTMIGAGASDTGQGAGVSLFDSANPATTLIRGSTISGNGAPGPALSLKGGGLDNEQKTSPTPSTTALVNSTIANNQASQGGGVYDESGLLSLSQATLSGDTATGAGWEIQSSGPPGTQVALEGSILDGTTSTCAGTASGFLSQGHNIERGAACAGLTSPSDLHNTDPQLGALALNGGLTPTMALPSTSPAIDKVPASDCRDQDLAPISADQRGQPRPAGAGCDVGAFEFQPPAAQSPPSLPFSSGTNTKCFGKKVTIIGTGAPEVLVGTAGNDVIASMGGADKINAGGGNDIVCGGPGNDRIKGGGGDDTLLGQGGRDTLIGGGGRDLLNAGAGRKETCNGGPGKDIAKGCESKQHFP